ncbi:MAG: hypothetical protein AB7W37_01245 [Syntrophobacteraceae bacterium]
MSHALSLAHGLFEAPQLEAALADSHGSPVLFEKLLIERGVRKDVLLQRLTELCRAPFVEFDESLGNPKAVPHSLDLEGLKKALWFPLSISNGVVTVAAFQPGDPLIHEQVKAALDIEDVRFVVALPSDIVRMIEHQQDVNPGFPPSAGRTVLANLRTWLAGERTQMAQFRTTMAQGRTGLAFIRTGFSFISIALVLLRMFGIGWLSILEVLLLGCGVVMTLDGIVWYLPARKVNKDRFNYTGTEHTFGTTILQVDHRQGFPVFTRTAPVQGADKLRGRWNRLTPVMKRRFLAIDRTDLAEERTILAGFRTMMARARTGLAFGRTGITFLGLGVALMRQFQYGPWTILDGALILTGSGMLMEGLHWYFTGRKAGSLSLEAIRKSERRSSIWEFIFPPVHRQANMEDLPSLLFLNDSYAPGIWGTTGLALERTLIAERRNVKARLRTIMARSRTGLAFVRTGTSVFSVGLGLLVYFGTGMWVWTAFNTLLILIGASFIADGLYWHIPAQRTIRQFPYCSSDMEISFPDYAKPSANWKKVVFSYDEM